jgi:hypothetical protein
MALQGRNGAPYEVPVELLAYVDDGGNPDAFIIDVIRSAAAANEAAKGKVEAFRYVEESCKVVKKRLRLLPDFLF